MGSFSLLFLKLALKCIDHLAWPLLAFGFQFWPYMKLMIIFWLIIPDFGRASYVYNHLINSCISMKPQADISCRLKRFIEENGTETLEKLIASKNTTHNPDAEAANAIGATDKKEIQQTNAKRLQTELKDINDLEVIEKKVIPAGKQDIPAAVPNLARNLNVSSALVETKGTAGKGKAVGELTQSSTHEKVQKEWTCAICLVTTTSEETLKCHLRGRKHWTTCEALKAKNQSSGGNLAGAQAASRVTARQHRHRHRQRRSQLMTSSMNADIDVVGGNS